MDNTPKKVWAKKMLEVDLQAQSGAIWTEEKSGLNAERKSKDYKVEDQYPVLLVPDSVFYNGKEVKCTMPSLIK